MLPSHEPARPPPDTAAYQRLRGLFDAALDCPPAQRDAWIAAHVPDPIESSALRRLIAADTDRGVLDTPALERAASIGENSFHADGLVGTRIGAFTLVRALGQGGMAAVFLGERDDPAFRQQVAVKLLRRGLYSDVEQRLFQRERRTLASLSHPNIAHLIDGGVTAAGVPYLILEYVDGQPITDYASEQRLDLPARLRLFTTVCRAVAAAHRVLIVHRDIKPSNLLIDREGRPKLLDFGIAKLLDERDELATGTAVPALTPGYAAPEQFTGGTISTATDVYALGVLLHELLLGRRPRGNGAGVRRPSSQVVSDAGHGSGLPLPVPALRTALRGDLDSVLQKAMATEPERRYASAAELGDDIERHLAGRPVLAHPPSRTYRLRKFVQRHRGGVALGVAFTLALVASLTVALWQAREARQQARRAFEVQDFVEQLFQPIEDGSAQAPTLQQLLARGAERIDQRAPNDPALRADLLALFARLQNAVGDARGNRALAYTAWQANTIAYGEDDTRTLEARQLHARVLRLVGERDAALAEYETVLQRLQALGVRDQRIARVLDAMSIVRMEQGISSDEAIALKHAVLAAREADPEVSADDLVAGYNNLGAAYQSGARFDDALQWYGKALDLGLATHGDSRGNANTLANIGAVQSYQGRWGLAAETLQRARTMYARVPIERSDTLASLLLRQCMVLAQLGRDAQARAVCDSVVTMTREVHGDTHVQHALALARRAGADTLAGRFEAAQAGYAQARALLAGNRSAWPLAVVDSDQARYWYARGDWPALRDAAIAVFDQPAGAGVANPGTRSPSAPLLAAWIALACHEAPASVCGERRLERAEASIVDPAFAQSVLRFSASLVLARLDLARSAPRRAIARLDTALPWADPDLAADHPQRKEWQRLRDDATRALGNPAD